MDEQLRAPALEHHRQPTAGKISITPTKELVNQHHLALAHSPGVFAAMNGVLLPNRILSIADTYVNEDPSPEEVAGITRMAAEEVSRFGLTPKIALLSHSNFGSADSTSARKMREARELLVERHPELELDGEMHGDAALSPAIRALVYPQSALKGEANLLVMPNLDAANIAFNLLKVTGGGGITIGPILLGANQP